MRQEYTREGTRIRAINLINDANELFIRTDYDSIPFIELIEKFHEHFGENADFNDFNIEAEYIHEDCLGYDKYDPGDYGHYIVITRKGS